MLKSMLNLYQCFYGNSPEDEIGEIRQVLGGGRGERVGGGEGGRGGGRDG